MYPLRIEGLLVGEESQYGVDPTLVAATHGVRGVGRIWSALSPEFAFPNLREDTVSNSLVGVAPGPAHGDIVTIDYTVQLMGAGAAYSSSTPVRPECDPLIRACAMSRTHVDTGSSESVSYALADTSHASVTAYVYAGGKRFVVVGIRGNMTWNPTAGGLGQIRFTLQGMVTGVTEVSVPTITYDSVIPPAAVAMGLAIVPSGQSSWTPRTAGFEVTTGHTLDRHDDVSGTDGIEGYFIGDTKSRLTITARAKDLTTYNAWSYAKSRLVHTIDATLGSVQYNKVDLDVGLAYLVSPPQPTEDGNFAAYTLEYMLRDLVLRFD